MSDRTPMTGDLIQAMRCMHAWETPEKRGSPGVVAYVGFRGLVIATWSIGRRTRLTLLSNGEIVHFSCGTHVVGRNWKIVRAGQQEPMSGSA